MNILREIRNIDRSLEEGRISFQEAADRVAPFTDAEPVRHGHWIEHTSWYKTQSCECSECGNIERGFDYPYEKESAIEHAGLYCRRCGAKMDEVTE